MSDLERLTWQSANYYQLLELPMDATTEELRASYKLLALVWDPSRFDRAEWKRLAAERRDLIDRAFSCLVSEESRTEYDSGLKRSQDDFVMPFKKPLQQYSHNWKALAAWMKERGVGQPFHRKMAFQAGDY